MAVDDTRLSELFSDIGVDVPILGEDKQKQEEIKPPVPELPAGTGGFYQLPLRETSTEGQLKNVVPIFRRLKDEELNDDLIGIAVKVLERGYTMYAEVPFRYQDRDFVARVEPHYRKPGSNEGRPEGWHRGISLFIRNVKPWSVGSFTTTPFKRPVDAPGAAPRAHLGVDIVVPIGTRVYPIAPGTVLETGQGGAAGTSVYILHEGDGLLSAYKHLSQASVSAGAKVGYNTVIGLYGDSGNAKGSPHLHYEVRIPRKGKEGSKYRRDYVHVNPSSYIGKEVGSMATKADIVQDIVGILNKYSSIESLLST